MYKMASKCIAHILIIFSFLPPQKPGNCRENNNIVPWRRKAVVMPLKRRAAAESSLATAPWGMWPTMSRASLATSTVGGRTWWWRPWAESSTPMDVPSWDCFLSVKFTLKRYRAWQQVCIEMIDWLIDWLFIQEPIMFTWRYIKLTGKYRFARKCSKISS